MNFVVVNRAVLRAIDALRCRFRADPVRGYIAGQTNSGELPTRVRWKEIPIRRAYMSRRRRARTAAQDILSAHELAVVFADCAGGRLEAWISGVVAAGPFPNVSVKLRWDVALRSLSECQRMK